MAGSVNLAALLSLLSYVIKRHGRDGLIYAKKFHLDFYLMKEIAPFDLPFVQSLLDSPAPHSKQSEIADFIQNYDSGSCLVAGYRGVGKTSLVNTTIRQCQKDHPDAEIIPITINVPEADKDGKFDKKQLMDRIAVGAYEAVRNHPNVPQSFRDEFFEQYFRVYNDIENKTTNTSETSRETWSINIRNIIMVAPFAIAGCMIYFSQSKDLPAITEAGLA